MSKRNSKSELIRQYMAKHPNAGGNEIAKALKVNAALVYNVKAIMKKQGKLPGKAGRKAVAAVAESGSTTAQVIAAAKLVKVCGSVEQARTALAAAAQVADVLAD